MRHHNRKNKMVDYPRFVMFVKTPLGEYILSSKHAVTQEEVEEAFMDIDCMLNGKPGSRGMESGLDIIDRFGKRVYIPTEVLRNSVVGFIDLEER
jgi:hypothetical protein